MSAHWQHLALAVLVMLAFGAALGAALAWAFPEGES